MKHIPQISEAEYEVMKVIWKYAPISTNDITDKLLHTTSWNPRTIQTLIKRLSDKSAISYEKKGRMFIYSPVISQEEYRKHESSSFLKKFFNGHISDMVSAFVDSDELSADDIKELQDILNVKGTGRK
jgi:BlaI family penicillinase repressor